MTLETIPQTAPRTPSRIRAETPPEIEYYYDSHPTEEDLMGQNMPQDRAIRYTSEVLEELFHEPGWYIACNLNIYQTSQKREYPVAPDIAVFIGVPFASVESEDLTSWKMTRPDRPHPQVVFEFASQTSEQRDKAIKPEIYAEMGVTELVYYDPRRRVPGDGRRLRVWSFGGGEIKQKEPDGRGWIWSEVLGSWLGPDDRHLRLYDREGRQRPTGKEAEAGAKERERAQKEYERAQKEIERAQKEIERAQKEYERAQKEYERAEKERARVEKEYERDHKEIERTQKEQERAQKEKAWAKLREMGIDPEA